MKLNPVQSAILCGVSNVLESKIKASSIKKNDAVKTKKYLEKAHQEGISLDLLAEICSTLSTSWVEFVLQSKKIDRGDTKLLNLTFLLSSLYR